MNFDYILNGNRGKKMKPAIEKISGFEVRGIGSILGDRVTKKQRVAIKRNPWADSDRDGVINGLDCAPRNKKKHMPYMYSYRHADESDNPRVAEAQEKMDEGRGTGWTGTGVYGYASIRNALAQKEGWRRSEPEPRTLKRIWVDNPKEFDTDEQYNSYMDASKAHSTASYYPDSDEREKYIEEAKNRYNRAGIAASREDVVKSLDESRGQEEQPVNFLMRRKGYDGVFASSGQDRYKYGSIKFGKSGDFKGKFIENDRILKRVVENMEKEDQQ